MRSCLPSAIIVGNLAIAMRNVEKGSMMSQVLNGGIFSWLTMYASGNPTVVTLHHSEAEEEIGQEAVGEAVNLLIQARVGVLMPSRIDSWQVGLGGGSKGSFSGGIGHCWNGEDRGCSIK